MYDRSQLIQLVRDKALQLGEFTLASGQTSNYYLDCRRVTLDSAGAAVIAEGILHELDRDMPHAIGGMAIGADPITAAVITLAGLRGRSLKGFIVRKQAKDHGSGRDVEGPVLPGEDAVIVEDVVTTGGSSLKAIQRAEAFGLNVKRVIAIVDRMQGGSEAFEKAGYPLTSLLTIDDLGVST